MNERAMRVERAILRERGLPNSNDEIRREVYRFLAMLDAALDEPDIIGDAQKAYLVPNISQVTNRLQQTVIDAQKAEIKKTCLWRHPIL
jgi:hypothetical protein